MKEFIPEYLSIICAGLTAFALAIVIVPHIIKQARERNLVDIPDHRKEHKSPIPTMGGIAIFCGLILSIGTWGGISAIQELKFILFGIIGLFLIGIYDDLKDLKANKKFIVQFVIASIVTASGVRVESLQGLFGVEELPLIAQYVTTILIIVGVTNAVNLIDGIDGLAGGIAAFNAFVFAILFFLRGEIIYTLLAISLAGALCGFLRYNFNPAQIFMGDTGSLFVGFLLAVFGIKYLQTPVQDAGSTLVIVYGLLILPVFDTLRVVGVRIWKGKSPFAPDRNHIHHLLIKTGYNHKQSAIIMYIANLILVIVAAFLSQLNLPILALLTVVTILAIFLSELLSVKRVERINNTIEVLTEKQCKKQLRNYLLTNLKIKNEEL